MDNGSFDGPKAEIQTCGSYCVQPGLGFRDLHYVFSRDLSPGMHMTRLVFIGYPEFPTSDAVLLRDISELNQDSEKVKNHESIAVSGIAQAAKTAKKKKR